MTYEKTPAKHRQSIRTKATKEIEQTAFDTLPTYVLISKLYKRHEMFIVYTAAVLAFTWAFYQYFN